MTLGFDGPRGNAQAIGTPPKHPHGLLDFLKHFSSPKSRLNDKVPTFSSLFQTNTTRHTDNFRISRLATI